MNGPSHARVMIVEDEVVTAMALRETVKDLGHEVVASLDMGEEAVKRARETHVDVVLMDIRLRGAMDGITAAETIRKETGVPSIYITAYSDQETLKRAKIAEPYGYLLKPFDEKELQAAIEIAVHMSAMERSRRRAEEALEARELLLQEVMDNSPAIIYVKDEDGRYALVNKAFERFFGTTRAAVRGRDDLDAMGEQARAALGPKDAKVQRSGDASDDEEDIVGRDGRKTFMSTRFPVRDARGAIVGVCGVLVDVTELKRTEEALRHSEARYRMIAGSSMDVISLCRGDGLVTFVSPSVSRLLGYLPDEVEGTRAIDLVHPEDRGDVGRAPPPVGPEATVVTFRARRKDGEYVWVESTVQQVLAREGWGEDLILGITRDVTERRQAEARVRKLNAELERRVEDRTRALAQANQQLEAFTRTVSHDLRGPVRGLEHLTATLEDDGSLTRAETSELVHLIRTQSRRLGRLLADLATFTRGTREDIERQDVDITGLAEEVVADLRREFPRRAVDVRVAEGLHGRGDELLLKLVLENLIGNAWKYTGRRPDAAIEVGGVAQEKGGTAFFVKDNGAGFDMSAAARLFEPFQRLHLPTEFPGTGLGLSSVKRIIERHGGRVWAEGKAGEGATFWFTLG